MAIETTTQTKSEAILQRKFADVGTRLQRADVLAHLLRFLLFVVSYAFAFAVFEEFVGARTTASVVVARYAGYSIFCCVATTLFVLTIRSAMRTINPYFIAQELERALPDAKNSLINWLDLHDDELPTAFQKHLSSRAADQWDDADISHLTKSPRNKVLLALLLLPTLGLLVLLVLNARTFAPTMGRAFVPFVAPEATPRTQITILEPTPSDTEVRADRPISFVVKLEGRVPSLRAHGAPMLRYRHDPADDFLAQPLQIAGDGTWTLSFPADKIRGGFWYTITAGDAITPEQRVRVRAKTFVSKFTVNHEPRPYRLTKKSTIVFPNEQEPKLAIRGLRGTAIELIGEVNRSVKMVDVALHSGKVAVTLPTRIAPDGMSFRTQWLLQDSGKLKITFKTNDGDDNSDREAYNVDVHDDESPRVVLTSPGKDVTLPANGILELAGQASDDHGIKAMALHIKVLAGPARSPLVPKVYRPGKSFRLADGSYPNLLLYRDFLALDELRNDKGTRIEFPAGTVLEYWLEAVDNADTPNPAGNIGKSSVYKITLTPFAKNTSEQTAKRKQAEDRQKQHEKQQDEENRQQKSDGAGDGAKSQQEQMNALEKEKNEAEQRIKDALNDQSDRGAAKSSQPDNAQAKSGPTESPDAPTPQSKGDAKEPPADPGTNKDQGQGMQSSAARDGGAKPPNGDAKGIEQHGPEIPNKVAQTAKGPPPNAQAKGGMSPDAGSPKGEPVPGKQPPGNARVEENAANKNSPTLDDIARQIDQLPSQGEAGDRAGQTLAKAARDANDPQVRDLIHDALKTNGRDPKTGGIDKKAPNPFGSGSSSDGIRDDIQVKAANREFARRLGQLQLDDWRKRLTPERLKKAGMTDADLQRFLKTAAAYDSLVQQWNAKLLRDALAKDFRGKSANLPGGAVAPTLRPGDTPLDPTLAAPPPELRDAQRRFTSPR